jgi:hypothetical protein
MGIGIGYYYQKDESDSPTSTFMDEHMKTEVSNNIIQIPLVAGFQWYFTEAISLGGEYRLSYRYESGETKYDGEKAFETTKSMFGFSAASVFFSVHY